MPTLRIEHGVRDYDQWKTAFDSDPVGRVAAGVRRYRISRPADDPRWVIVDLDFETAGDAEAFRDKLRALWASAGERLGLVDASARIVDVVESKDC